MIAIPKYKWKGKERTLEEIVQDYVSSVNDAYHSMDECNGDMLVSELQIMLRDYWRLTSICNTLSTEKDEATIPTRY